MQDFILLPFLAFALTVVLHFLALRVFPRLGLLDFPERYGLTRARLPYPTGIIAVMVFAILFAAIFLKDRQDIGLLAGVLLLAVVCFRDDRRPLSPPLRLMLQALVALVIFLLGTRIYTLTNPLAGLIGGPVLPLDTAVIPSPLFADPSVWGALFTVGWLLLTINALNWFDGIPGQVSLLSVIGFLVIGGLALLRGNPFDPEQYALAVLSFLLAATALGGLLFDAPPHRVLMGDTGAMFFGLMLGVLTIYAGGKVATAFLVLGVPLIDSVIVVIKRLLRGRSALQGGRDHLHHLLLARGWTERQVIALTAAIGTAFGCAALFLTTLQKFLAGLALFFLMVLLHIRAEKHR